MFVGLIVIAMTAEMAGGIHCSQAVHDGHDDEEKGGELHDGNGLIQVGCIRKLFGACGSVDCGNKTKDP